MNLLIRTLLAWISAFVPVSVKVNAAEPRGQLIIRNNTSVTVT
ncbi:MAG: hypothetical protein R3F37_05900 [Candidatus Competibacteraceae bacterium]